MCNRAGSLLFLLVCCVATAPSSAQCPVEIEAPCAGPIQYSEHLSSCNVGVGQTFAIQFEGSVDDWIWIAIGTTAGGWQPKLQLLSPTGALLLESDCAGVPCSTNLPWTVLTEAGTYTIQVFDVGLDEAGEFHLNLEQRRPDGSACPISLGATKTSDFLHGTDVDFFSFSATQGASVHVTIEALSAVDPRVAILDSTGVGIASFLGCTQGPCVFTAVSPPLPEAGEYVLMVWENGLDESGDYSIRLDCPDADTSFGTNGVVTINLGSAESGLVVEPLPDGNVVVFGKRNGLVVAARLDETGTLDPTFGTNGVYTGPSFNLTDAAVRPTGELVMVGGPFSAMQLLADGTLDMSFGVGGTATQSVVCGFQCLPQAISVAALGIQPDGKLVLAGQSNFSFTGNFRVALMRYNSNGTVDNSFTVSTGSGSDRSAAALKILDSGKIVITGRSSFSLAGSMLTGRYNSNGTIDCSFASTSGCNGGFVTESFGTTAFARGSDLAVQSDGKLVCVGSADGVGYSAVRYQPEGVIDSTYGMAGTVTSGGGSAAIAIQDDDRIVALGGGWSVRRYTTDGELDATFGAGQGTMSIPVGGGEANDVAIQADGKIVLVGTYNNNIVVARFNSESTILDCNGNGQPDDCDLALELSADCNNNGVPDECDIASGLSADCNSNGVPDSCDLSSGMSSDNNANGAPDECEPDFVRCDANGDGALDISDSIKVLDLLFAGGSVSCMAAVDCNDDDVVDIGDAVFSLEALFALAQPPRSPFPGCGDDPTNGVLSCSQFTFCP